MGQLPTSRWAATISGIFLTAILCASYAQSVVNGASQPTYQFTSATAQLQRTKNIRGTPHPRPSQTASVPKSSIENTATPTPDLTKTSLVETVRSPVPSSTIPIPAEESFLETALAFMPMDVVEFFFNI